MWPRTASPSSPRAPTDPHNIPSDKSEFYPRSSQSSVARREWIADERDRLAEERDRIANHREDLANERARAPRRHGTI